MEKKEQTLRTCKQGHKYFKSSDCPVCPVCEKARLADNSEFGKIGAPAKRALEQIGVKELKQLKNFTEKELLAQHGIGKSVIERLKILMRESGMSFK